MAKVTLRNIKRSTSATTRRPRNKAGRATAVVELTDPTPIDGAESGASSADRGPTGASAGASPSPSSETPPTAQDDQASLGDQADGQADDLADDDDVVTLEIGAQPDAPRGRGRPRAPRPPEPEPKGKTAGVALGADASALLLTIIDAITVNNLGPDAKFNTEERKLIEPSLKRMLARMTPASAKMFGAVADPVLLATGLIMWGGRVFGSRPRPASPAVQQHVPVSQQPPTNIRQPVPAPPGDVVEPAAAQPDPGVRAAFSTVA